MGDGRRNNKRYIGYAWRAGFEIDRLLEFQISDIIKNMESILNFISSNLQMIYLVVLMIFVGVELISHVPSVLHTPLMSGANAIHGVVVIGSIIVMGQAHDAFSLLLGFFAVVLGTLNVVGGFVVTDRMLEMFRKKK